MKEYGVFEFFPLHDTPYFVVVVVVFGTCPSLWARRRIDPDVFCIFFSLVSKLQTWS